MAKICILLPRHWCSAKGGAEFQAHLLADFLARTTSHDILYLTRHLPSDCIGLAYRVAHFGGPAPQKFGMAWDSIALYRALHAFRPNVIIQRVACAYTGVAAIYCEAQRARLLWHISSDKDPSDEPELPISWVAGFIDRPLFRYGVKRASAIVAQTESQGRDLAATYGRTATMVVPNFAEAPERIWRKSGKFTVLWIANLKPLKRPEIFIQMARDLARHDIGFKIIGRRASNAWCDSIVEEISHEPNIEYLGELELDQVNDELERAHLLVNTSRYEGLPNTFIQGWMREVPTVTLNIDPDGMIARFGLGDCASDFDTLKRKVLEYFAEREKLQEIAVAARAFALKTFSMSNARRLQSLVEALAIPTKGNSAPRASIR